VKKKGFLLLVLLAVMACACVFLLLTPPEAVTTAVSPEATADPNPTLTAYLTPGAEEESFSLAALPAFDETAYAVVNDNVPYYRLLDLSEDSFEFYSDHDALERCGVCYASVGTDLMPTEERGDIGSVKPTGWVTAKYDFVDGKYLYNRCHLLGFQLTGENANERNLITGTRYMNVQGMLPFENMVADYVKETGNHVLYRVTPVYEGDDLVAQGVLMEACSVEDRGEGVLFCVWCYNVQPGVEIDYATGESREDPSLQNADDIGTYILNTGSMKFHRPECSGAVNMSEKNRQEYTGSRKQLILSGYTPCGTCEP